jgi:hypothetical protein
MEEGLRTPTSNSTQFQTAVLADPIRAATPRPSVRTYVAYTPSSARPNTFTSDRSFGAFSA